MAIPLLNSSPLVFWMVVTVDQNLNLMKATGADHGQCSVVCNSPQNLFTIFKACQEQDGILSPCLKRAASTFSRNSIQSRTKWPSNWHSF